MEDDLKILKVEYLITCKIKLRLPSYVLKWRWLQMEDNLKISIVEYPSNHLLDHTQFLNLSFIQQSNILQVYVTELYK